MTEKIAKPNNRKRGRNHHNHIGEYITPNGTFRSSIEAAKANGTYDNKILRYCRSGMNGYGFKVTEGKEPQWYLDIINSSKGLQNTVLLGGNVTRGRSKVMFLTPNGLFGDISTAAKHNLTVSEHDIKKHCIMGKKGWGVFNL